MDREELTNFISKRIYHWVGRNFGSQEAENPSWNIKELSAFLGKELDREFGNTQPMDSHELTVLSRTDSDCLSVIEMVKGLVRQHGGKIISEENCGKKRLAYSIQGEEYANYLYFEIGLPKDAPAKVSSTLNLKDEILRYLLVKKDTRR